MPRFSLRGKPAGRTYHVGGKRFIATNAVDGGVALKEEDQKYLIEHGYKLDKAPDKAPIADPENKELVTIAENRIREGLAKSRADQAVARAAGAVS